MSDKYERERIALRDRLLDDVRRALGDEREGVDERMGREEVMRTEARILTTNEIRSFVLDCAARGRLNIVARALDAWALGGCRRNDLRLQINLLRDE